LSLVVITQTEAQIGGAEKSAVRALFAAESGLHMQVGLHFLQLDPAQARFELDTSDASETIVAMDLTVDVSPFYPIYAGPCAICSVNHGSEQRYYVNNYVVNAQSARGTASATQASKLLSAMFMIQPEPQPGGGVDDAIRTYNPDQDPNDTQPGLTAIYY
ncbi:MAG: hypothetical protein ACREQY_13820, partial [Candidatus Binatia bacterium]